jgi:hypothetical protein
LRQDVPLLLARLNHTQIQTVTSTFSVYSTHP